MKDGLTQVKELKDKIHELTEIEKEHQCINVKLRAENKRLNNIISELEKFICDLEIECNIDNSMWGVAVIIHNKLKELKGSDKE